MVRYEFHYALPKPRRPIYRFRTVSVEFRFPSDSISWVHLSCVSLPDDSGEKSRRADNFVASDAI